MEGQNQMANLYQEQAENRIAGNVPATNELVDDDNITTHQSDPSQLMPGMSVKRIMRRILPPHAKISEDSKELVQECTSQFIDFITGEANDHCQADRRKTISAEDIIKAFSTLGFDNYVGPLTLFLNRYRQSQATPTIMHRDPSAGLPNILIADPMAYMNDYNLSLQYQQALFDQATTSQYYFQGGSSSDPQGTSQFVSASSFAQVFPPNQP